MFDIGFSELFIIGIVALIVIGPERLPKVARTAGAWLGRLNRYVSDVKGDIDRELRLEELRKMQQEMKDSVQKYELLARESGEEIKDEIAREAGQVEKVMQAMAATDGGLAMREYERIREENTESAEVAGSEVKPADEAPASDGPYSTQETLNEEILPDEIPAPPEKKPEDKAA